MEKLSIFIDTERERFVRGKHSNLFAFSFSQIVRYHEFLKIISTRYEKASMEFIANTKTLQKTILPGKSFTSEDELKLSAEGEKLNTILHLEIESFYLFAKILLDKVARATEFYFGQARGLSLDSHDDMSKNFEPYIKTKGLTILSDELKRLISQLKKDISDYRDKQIAHEKSPRTIKGTAFKLDTGESQIINIKLYPTEKDQQFESKEINQMIWLLEQYICEMVDYISLNRDKTNLELV